MQTNQPVMKKANIFEATVVLFSLLLVWKYHSSSMDDMWGTNDGRLLLEALKGTNFSQNKLLIKYPEAEFR